MITAKVTSMTVSQYGSTPSGHIHIACSDGSTISMSVDKDIAAAIFAVVLRKFEERQPQYAQAVATIKPAALIPYDESKTIDDEIPF